MRIDTQKEPNKETARAILENMISPLTAALTLTAAKITGTPLEESGVPVVWTPVINSETNEVSVVPSLIVASPDGEHILVHSTDTDVMDINDVHYIFTEKSEAEAFVDGYTSSNQLSVEINCLVSNQPTSAEITCLIM